MPIRKRIVAIILPLIVLMGLFLLMPRPGSTQSGTPSITSLTPSSVRAGIGGFTLTVNGSNFATGAVVRFNGLDRSTTFISATKLAASILSADIGVVGTFPITVRNPGGQISSSRTLTVIPSVTNLSPLSVEVNSSDFTLTVEGEGFVLGSQIRWDGSSVETTFVNSTTLTASIDNNDVESLDTVSITVRNPDPYQFTSNAINFKITNPPPATECPAGDSAELSNPGKIEFGPSRSQMWRNDNIWWGVFSDHIDGVYFYKQTGPTAFTRGDLIHTNSVGGTFVAGWPDVLWNGTDLFVFIQESFTLARLYKYSYSSGSQTYSLLPGFPVSLPLLGNAQSVSIDQDSTGKVWAAYAGSGPGGDGNVRVIWSTSADHTAWDTTGFVLASGVSVLTAEAAAIVRFGNRIGVAWSNQNALEDGFRFHTDGQPETSWSAKEIIDSGLGPQGFGGVADNHLSIRAHPDGRVLLAAKDSDGNGHIHFYIRSTAGTWGAKTLIVNDFEAAPTRPQLLLDTDNNQVHVIYKDASVRGGARTFITQASLTNPVFNTPCVIIDTSLSTPTSSNPTTTKQNINATTDLMVAASTGAIGNSILFNTVDITPNVVTIFNLSPKEVTAGESSSSLTLTVNGKLFNDQSDVLFNGSIRSTTFVDPGKLRASISSSLTATAGSYPITVQNSGGALSNAVSLLVTPQNPLPVVKSIFPDRFEQGSPQFTITVRGTGFRRTSRVRFNGSNRTTQFVSDTTLTATITATDLLVAGAFPITVFNQTPGGGTSAVNKLTIFYVQPTCVVPLPTSFPGVTVFNTVKAQMWFNDNLWWGAFSDNLDGVYFYKQSGSSFTKGALIESNYNGRPDVLWNGTNLFVLMYEFNTLARLYKYSYNTSNDTYTLISGFPINLPLFGMGAGISDAESGSITLAQDSTGKLWAAYPGSFIGGDGNYRVIWSTSADHKTWETTGFTLASGGSTLHQEVAPIVHFGGNKIGIAWSNQVSKELAFRYHVDGDPETTWSAKEVIDSGLGDETGLGGVADNHLSMKAAPDGRLFLVAKDSDGVGYLHLYTRSAAGAWSNPVPVDPDPLAQNTRPALVLDLEHSDVYVLYNNSAEGLMYINKANMNSPVFLPACPYIDAVSASDVTTTKQNLNATTGLRAVASDGGPLSQIYINPITLAPGSGGNPVPTLSNISPTSVGLGSSAFTLTLNGSNFVNGSVVYFNGSDRATTFVSSSQLTAKLLATDLGTVGAHQLRVMNPRGGTSSAVNLSISTAITSLSPPSVNVNSGAFTLTVNGIGFASGATVRYNGSNRTTTFISPNQLTAQISSSDVTTVGVRPITVNQSGTTSAAINFSVNNPTPVISAISPTGVNVGGSSTTLTVDGSGFLSGSVINFNGQSRTTTFVNSTRLTATISSSDRANRGLIPITVSNPAPGGGISNAVDLAINNIVPTLTSISPTNKTAGDAAFTLTVNGTNYNSSSIVRFNGADRPTTLVSSTRVTAQLSAADVAVGGSFGINVFNPPPGGGSTSIINLTVNNLAPTLTGISPASKTAGDAASTLTITGTNYNPSSIVRINGGDRPTTLVNSTQLTTLLTAADLAAAGTLSISVFNPAPGGGNSGSVNFTINNPLPSLSSVSPSIMTAGDAASALTVNGSGYNGNSIVRINGIDRGTTFVNDTQLTVEITGADLSAAGTLSISVINPAPGGGISEVVDLSVNNPKPEVNTLLPGLVFEGSADFTLLVTGENFNSSSVVLWNGQARATSLLSNSQLMAQITAADVISAATVNVTVSNPAPGGGSSEAVAFTIAVNPRVISLNNSSGATNSTVTIPVQIVAQGDENAIGFSLSFDTALLSNPVATLGTDSGEATLNTNSSLVAQGRFGIVLSLPAGLSFAAGSRHVVNVTFSTAAVGTVTTTQVAFVDLPVVREVANLTAETLPTNYLGGLVTLTLGYEADVAPRPTGNNNGIITVADWSQVGRFSSGVDIPALGSEFQRADCAPASTLGNGAITVADWTQAGRYASGLDPVTPAGGPTGEPSAPQLAQGAAAKSSIARESFALASTVVRVGTDFTGGQKRREIPIEVEAQGNENAFGFSLVFDPSRWSFIAARAGDELDVATVHLNKLEVKKGQVGIVIALPAGTSIGPGKHQLVVLTFKPLSDDQRSNLITFGDKPVAREVVDVNANPVKAIFELPAALGLYLLQDQQLNLHRLSSWTESLKPQNLTGWEGQFDARSTCKDFQVRENLNCKRPSLKLERLSSWKESLKPQNLTGWEGRFTPAQVAQAFKSKRSTQL
jgi:hypothetical protein